MRGIFGKEVEDAPADAHCLFMSLQNMGYSTAGIGRVQAEPDIFHGFRSSTDQPWFSRADARALRDVYQDSEVDTASHADIHMDVDHEDGSADVKAEETDAASSSFAPLPRGNHQPFSFIR